MTPGTWVASYWLTVSHWVCSLGQPSDKDMLQVWGCTGNVNVLSKLSLWWQQCVRTGWQASKTHGRRSQVLAVTCVSCPAPDRGLGLVTSFCRTECGKSDGCHFLDEVLKDGDVLLACPCPCPPACLCWSWLLALRETLYGEIHVARNRGRPLGKAQWGNESCKQPCEWARKPSDGRQAQASHLQPPSDPPNKLFLHSWSTVR